MRKKDVKVGASVFWEDPNGGVLSRYLRVAAVGDEFVALTELGDPTGTIITVVPPRELTKPPKGMTSTRPKLRIEVEIEYDFSRIPPSSIPRARADIEARARLVFERASDDSMIIGDYGEVVSCSHDVRRVNTSGPGDLS